MKLPQTGHSGFTRSTVLEHVWVLVDRREGLTCQVAFEVADVVLFEQGVDLTPTVMDDAEWLDLLTRERRIARDIESEGILL